MGIITNRLSKILSIKESIKAALRDKDVEMDDDVKFEDYPKKVGDVKWKVPANSTLGVQAASAEQIKNFVKNVDVSEYLNKNNCPMFQAGTFTDLTPFKGLRGLRNLFAAFAQCDNLETADMREWDLSEVTTMAQMFASNKALQDVDMTGISAPKCTSLDNAFQGVKGKLSLKDAQFDELTSLLLANSSVTSLDLNGLVAPKLTNLSFYGLSSLTEELVLDGLKLDSIKVINMSGNSIKSLKISNIYAPLLGSNGSLRFGGSYALESVDLSECNIGGVLSSMFEEGSNTMLKSIKLGGGGWTYATSAFSGLQNLELVDLTKCDFTDVTYAETMFYGCRALKNIVLPSMPNTTDVNNMFCNCQSLESIDFEKWNANKVENAGAMFYACLMLKSVDLSNLDWSEAYGINNMFYNCTNIKKVKMPKLGTSLKPSGTVFYNCSKLTLIDFSGSDLSATNISGMFSQCAALEEVIVKDCNEATKTKLKEALKSIKGKDWVGDGNRLVPSIVEDPEGPAMMLYLLVNHSSVPVYGVAPLDVEDFIPTSTLFNREGASSDGTYYVMGKNSNLLAIDYNNGSPRELTQKETDWLSDVEQPPAEPEPDPGEQPPAEPEPDPGEQPPAEPEQQEEAPPEEPEQQEEAPPEEPEQPEKKQPAEPEPVPPQQPAEPEQELTPEQTPDSPPVEGPESAPNLQPG